MQKKLITEPIVREFADIAGKTIKRAFEKIRDVYENRLYITFTDGSCCIIEIGCYSGNTPEFEIVKNVNDREALALGLITQKQYDKDRAQEEAIMLNNRTAMYIKNEKKLLRELATRYPDVLKEKQNEL